MCAGKQGSEGKASERKQVSFLTRNKPPSCPLHTGLSNSGIVSKGVTATLHQDVVDGERPIRSEIARKGKMKGSHNLLLRHEGNHPSGHGVSDFARKRQ